MLRTLLRSSAATAVLAVAGASMAVAQDCPNCAPGARASATARHAGYGSHVVNDGVGYHDFAGPGGYRTSNVGNCQYRFYGQPDLFYNYYVPGNCGGVGAEMYLSPRPVPPLVGHTAITYQPFYPHEYMYEHGRTYHRYYNGGQGLTRTHVHYSHSPFTALKWW